MTTKSVSQLIFENHFQGWLKQLHKYILANDKKYILTKIINIVQIITKKHYYNTNLKENVSIQFNEKFIILGSLQIRLKTKYWNEEK